MPVALVDRENQWIKASRGLPERRRTSREVSFCAPPLVPAPMIVRALLDDGELKVLNTRGERVQHVLRYQ